jgi:Ner family transcriptional regulator
MDRIDIQFAIRKKGYTLRNVATNVGVTPSVVTEIVSGRKRSRRVALEISSITGFPVSQLWPGQYPRLELEELRSKAA